MVLYIFLLCRKRMGGYCVKDHSSSSPRGRTTLAKKSIIAIHAPPITSTAPDSGLARFYADLGLLCNANLGFCCLFDFRPSHCGNFGLARFSADLGFARFPTYFGPRCVRFRRNNGKVHNDQNDNKNPDCLVDWIRHYVLSPNFSLMNCIK